MSPRILSLAAAFMLACTHNHNTNITVNNCDTMQQKKVLLPAAPISVSAEVSATKETSHELPFFKEVLDFKRLYW